MKNQEPKIFKTYDELYADFSRRRDHYGKIKEERTKYLTYRIAAAMLKRTMDQQKPNDLRFAIYCAIWFCTGCLTTLAVKVWL